MSRPGLSGSAGESAAPLVVMKAKLTGSRPVLYLQSVLFLTPRLGFEGPFFANPALRMVRVKPKRISYTGADRLGFKIEP